MTVTRVLQGDRSRREWLATTALRVGLLVVAWRVVIRLDALVWPAFCAGQTGWGAVNCGALYGALVPIMAAELVLAGTALFLAYAAVANARDLRAARRGEPCH